MVEHRLDNLAKRLALGLSRRRLIGGMAAATVAGAVPRPAAARAAFPKWPSDCFPYPSCCITPILNGPGCVCEGGPCGCDPCEDGGKDDSFAMTTYEFSSTALDGIAGAGTVRTEGGMAHFALFASGLSNIPDLPSDSAVPVARVQWRDAEADLTLESTVISFYGPVEGEEGSRVVLGKMRVNGGEEFPFVLHAVAAEPVGGGPETVRLLVGDAVREDAEAPALGFAYAAEGDLVAGDLQLLDIDMSQQIIQQTIPA